MGAADRPLITAASLRARYEWSRVFPGAAVAWQDEANEGDGFGFDNLDPSAMVRAYMRTVAPSAVLHWYRDQLAALGWAGTAVQEDSWWEWVSPARPGERFDLLDRGRSSVPTIVARIEGTTLYEILFTAGRGDGSTGAVNA
jgi:hypothetical protein